MTNSGRHLPKEVIEHWPEVFEDVRLNSVPMEYLNTVLINFKDGKTWEIKITQQTKRNGWGAFERSLSELCKNYETKISDIDFKLDTHKVKKDIERSTQKFLKKKKL